jgi:ribonuclease Z
MLEPDIGYRVAHHDDLQRRPSSVVTEVNRGVIFDQDSVRVTAAPEITRRSVQPSASASTTEASPWRSPVTQCHALDWTNCALVPTYWCLPLFAAISWNRSACPRLTDVLGYHSSVPDAAQTAARNGVRTLVLSHLVPAPAPGTEQEWLDQVTAHFSGKVVLAEDLLTLDVAG